MIWSSFGGGRYLVLEAESDSLFGEWEHHGSKFDFDGGHAMLFYTLDGKRMISLHSPNKSNFERAFFAEYGSMRNIILGTDWFTDCDDAVALRLLCRAHMRGEINLSAVVINACLPDSVPSLDGFITLEGCSLPLIGIDHSATVFKGSSTYQRRLSEYASVYRSNEDAEDGVRVYRRALANAKERVDICEIGFLQVLAALIESEGDDISPQSGIELIRQKVGRLYIMGGRWDVDGGMEYNFSSSSVAAAAAHTVLRYFPRPITLLGWEIGNDVITGKHLRHDDHLKVAMCDHGSPCGRPSWDPMLVSLALCGDADTAGYRCVEGTAYADTDTGANHFTPCNSGQHRYVIKKCDSTFYEKIIDELIK